MFGSHVFSSKRQTKWLKSVIKTGYMKIANSISLMIILGRICGMVLNPEVRNRGGKSNHSPDVSDSSLQQRVCKPARLGERSNIPSSSPSVDHCSFLKRHKPILFHFCLPSLCLPGQDGAPSSVI